MCLCNEAGDKLFATFWGISSHSISLFHLLPLLEQTIRGEVYFYILCLCCGANGPEHVEMGQRRPLRHSDWLPVGNTIQTLQRSGHHTACPFLIGPLFGSTVDFQTGGQRHLLKSCSDPHELQHMLSIRAEMYYFFFIYYFFGKLIKHFKSYSPFGLTWF